MGWILVTMVVVVASGAVAFVRGRRKTNHPEVGAVSDEWIAQHRPEPPQS
jgi:hypothetical protein